MCSSKSYSLRFEIALDERGFGRGRGPGGPHGDLKAVSRVEKVTIVGRTAFDQEWP